MMALRCSGLAGLAAAVALVGCGETSSGDSRTATADGSRAGSSRIEFESPGVRAGVVTKGYECGGGTIWLPVRWGSVPDGTEEIVLYNGRFKRESVGGARKVVVPFASLVQGVEPELHRLPVTPAGPTVSMTSFRPFNSCPWAKRGQNILLVLFAVGSAGKAAPERPSAAFGARLTEEALGVARPRTASKAAARLVAESLAVGRLMATYGPR